jgi:hypothetical protein
LSEPGNIDPLVLDSLAQTAASVTRLPRRRWHTASACEPPPDERRARPVPALATAPPRSAKVLTAVAGSLLVPGGAVVALAADASSGAWLAGVGIVLLAVASSHCVARMACLAGGVACIVLAVAGEDEIATVALAGGAVLALATFRVSRDRRDPIARDRVAVTGG